MWVMLWTREVRLETSAKVEDDNGRLLRRIVCCLTPSRCWRVADAAVARDDVGEAGGLDQDVVDVLPKLVVPWEGGSTRYMRE